MIGRWTLLVALIATLPLGAIVELRGEFLYLRPSTCNRDYVVVDRAPLVLSNPIPRGAVALVPAEHEPGFRLSLGWLDCATLYNLGLSYTRLHSSQSATTGPAVSGGAIWGTVGVPLFVEDPFISQPLSEPLGNREASARSRERLHYDAADLQVGHRSHHNGNFCLRTWGAVHFAHLERLRAVNYRGMNPFNSIAPLHEVEIDSSACEWGLGPKIGVDFRLAFDCGLGLGGLFAGGLLAGDRAYTLRERDENFDLSGDLIAAFPAEYRVGPGLAFFPVLNARLGLNYGWCGQCLSLLVEVGYEWLVYPHGLPMIDFASEGASFSLLCEDVRFDGIYAGGRLEF